MKNFILIPLLILFSSKTVNSSSAVTTENNGAFYIYDFYRKPNCFYFKTKDSTNNNDFKLKVRKQKIKKNNYEYLIYSNDTFYLDVDNNPEFLIDIDSFIHYNYNLPTVIKDSPWMYQIDNFLTILVFIDTHGNAILSGYYERKDTKFNRENYSLIYNHENHRIMKLFPKKYIPAMINGKKVGKFFINTFIMNSYLYSKMKSRTSN